MTKKKNELDVKNIDYDKLAIAIITEWDSDREESGQQRTGKGYVLYSLKVPDRRRAWDH